MRYLLFLIFLVSLFSCKDKVEKKEEFNSEEPLHKVQLIHNPTTDNSILPRLFSDSDQLFMSWIRREDSVDVLQYSHFSKDEWSEAKLIAKGSDWFTNWADFPNIAYNNGSVLVHYLQKSASGTYTYDIKMNLFSEEKKKWKPDFILHDDGTKSEHGFVSMVPFQEKDFFVSWLDGRNTAGGHDSHDEHNANGAMTLRGAFISSEGTIYKEHELDERVCDCCQTSAAMTTAGPVVVYRDRSDAEVRDISIVRWIENEGWSEPVSVHDDVWKIEGCPVNGPSIDAIESNVVVAWFSEAKGKPKVQVSFSEDGGATFGIPIRVDTNETLGRVSVVLLDAETAVVCWLENKDDQTFIQLRSVDSSGARGDVITLATTSSDRDSGFPQIARVGETLMAAWTDVSEGATTQIKTAQIQLKEL